MKKTMMIICLIGFAFSLTACNGKENPRPDKEELVDINTNVFPVERTIEGIVLDQEGVIEIGGNTHEVDFYRNLSYDAGLEGKYTFLVINPANNPDAEAPLWVYFHGGGVGYFGDDGEYYCLSSQNEFTWNKEETYDSMINSVLYNRIYDKGKLEDNTLTRRLNEGYRVLQVSYSDHDFYSGMGTEYTNNPKGGEVNGLQASMSALDYVVESYQTTHVFTHGTSAGAVGAYSLALAYRAEGIQLSGVISDSILPTPDMKYIYDEFAGHENFKHPAGFNYDGMAEKVGPFADRENGLYASNIINQGYDVPLFGIGGRKDPFFADHIYTHPAAREKGYNSNADWLHRYIIAAIENQENIPHRVELYDHTGHVPTVTEHSFANDHVDEFIGSSLEYNAEYPFE